MDYTKGWQGPLAEWAGAKVVSAKGPYRC